MYTVTIKYTVGNYTDAEKRLNAYVDYPDDDERHWREYYAVVLFDNLPDRFPRDTDTIRFHVKDHAKHKRTAQLSDEQKEDLKRSLGEFWNLDPSVEYVIDDDGNRLTKDEYQDQATRPIPK